LGTFLWLRRSPVAIAAALVLAAGSAVALSVQSKVIDAQYTVAGQDLTSLSIGAELFERDTGESPARLEDLVPRYLTDLHADPWGRSYVSFRGPGGLALVSAGRDGERGTPDDLVLIRQ